MNGNTRTRAIALSLREVAFLAIVAVFVAGYALAYQPASREAVSSSEVRFTDPSPGDLSIVPASCESTPQYPHTAGECSTSCTAQYYCSGSDRYYRNAQCQQSFVESCEYGCLNGVCLDAEGMYFQSFSATDQYGTAFTATGHLQIRPSIVRTGDATRLFWNVVNATSCTIEGTNGDSFTGIDSGAGGTVTGAISQQTLYTLSCVNAATDPSSISETVTVNILPVFCEPGTTGCQ